VLGAVQGEGLQRSQPPDAAEQGVSRHAVSYKPRPDHRNPDQDVDIGLLAMETDDQLRHLWSVWAEKLKTIDPGDAQGQFRSGLMSLAYSYARLAALSFGFQHAFGKKASDPHVFLQRVGFDVLAVRREMLTCCCSACARPRTLSLALRRIWVPRPIVRRIA
jgi:hypothetical protein